MSESGLLEVPKTGKGGSFTSTALPPFQLNDEAVLDCEYLYIRPVHFTSKVVMENNQLKWEPPEINCHLLAEANLPTTTRGGTVKSTAHPPYQVNDVATLHCGLGYVKRNPNYPTVSQVILVNKREVWRESHLPCAPLNPVKELPKTKPGSFLDTPFKPPYHINDTVTVSCGLGYVLPRKRTATVIMKGGFLAWDEATLNCLPVSCGRVPYVPNAEPRSNEREYVYEQFVVHECKKGYRLTFSGRKVDSQCFYTGKFVPPLQVVHCDPVQCPELKLSENVIMTSAERRFKSVAYFQCDKNNVMTKGDAIRVCQADGTWSGDNVQCGKRTYFTYVGWVLLTLILLILMKVFTKDSAVNITLKERYL